MGNTHFILRIYGVSAVGKLIDFKPHFSEPSFNIVEIFESLQGEGLNTGMPSIFVRFGKCNLACPWCDTHYNKFERWSATQIQEKVRSFSAKNIIITGGEPTIVPKIEFLLEQFKYALSLMKMSCPFASSSSKKSNRIIIIFPLAKSMAKWIYWKPSRNLVSSTNARINQNGSWVCKRISWWELNNVSLSKHRGQRSCPVERDSRHHPVWWTRCLMYLLSLSNVSKMLIFWSKSIKLPILCIGVVHSQPYTLFTFNFSYKISTWVIIHLTLLGHQKVIHFV